MSHEALSPNAAAGLDRLNGLLPLASRQAALDAPLRALHRCILRSFVTAGAPPPRADLAENPGVADIDTALQHLADNDLVVLTPDRNAIAGAYPFTLEERVHRVRVNGHGVRAMCALDALSIAPMFNVPAHIESACHVSAEPVMIDMQGREIVGAQPAAPVVGIRWQGTSGCAAQSLCLEMVFLRDMALAKAWQEQDPGNISLYSLAEAVDLGAAFFCSLPGPGAALSLPPTGSGGKAGTAPLL